MMRGLPSQIPWYPLITAPIEAGFDWWSKAYPTNKSTCSKISNRTCGHSNHIRIDSVSAGSLSCTVMKQNTLRQKYRYVSVWSEMYCDEIRLQNSRSINGRTDLWYLAKLTSTGEHPDRNWRSKLNLWLNLELTVVWVVKSEHVAVNAVILTLYEPAVE